MKTYDLSRRARDAGEGEAILGSEDTGSHACYMIYGLLKPGEKGRVARPGSGHEEIILAAKGDLEVTGAYSGTLREGSALYLVGEQECMLRNKSLSEAIYVVSGGHSGSGHH
jgi:hypothetical protein